MIVPDYQEELLALLERTRRPLPLPAEPVPGGPIQHRIRAWRDRPETVGPLVFYHADGARSSEGSRQVDQRVQFSAPADYYVLRLGHVLTPLSLLLALVEEDLLDRPTVQEIDNRLLSRHRVRYGNLLLPPEILGALVKACVGPGSDVLTTELNRARERLYEPVMGLPGLRLHWISLRRRAARLGADAHMATGQVEVLELCTDVFILEAAAWYDLLRAQTRREAAAEEYPTVASVLADRHEHEGLLYEDYLAFLSQPETYSDVRSGLTDRQARYLARRERERGDGRLRITDRDWQPDLTLETPNVVASGSPDTPSPSSSSAPVLRRSPGRPEDQDNPPDASPDDVDYRTIREALAAEIVGRESLVDELALAALLFRCGQASRLLLTGPTGSGKTFAARALAEAAGVPSVTVSAADLVETGYRGTNVGDLLVPLLRTAGSVEAAARSALVIDELDKLRIPPGRSDPVGHHVRMGQQESLLGLIGGGTPVRVTGAFGTSENEIDTSGMLIIMTGAFSTCSWSGIRAPTTGDLVKTGYLPELAERVGQCLHLPPRTGPELAQLYRARRDVPEILAVASDLGYTIEVADATYSYVAHVVVGETKGLGPRSGMSLLLQAIRRRLIQILKDGASKGTHSTVTPDDLVIPGPPDSQPRDQDQGDNFQDFQPF